MYLNQVDKLLAASIKSIKSININNNEDVNIFSNIGYNPIINFSNDLKIKNSCPFWIIEMN